MKFAIHYTNLFRHYDEVDEVLFDFKDINRDQIVDFLPSIVKKDNQKIILNISAIENETIPDILPYLLKLKSIHSNFLVQIDLVTQKDIVELLKDNNLEFMFINYCNNYELFYSMINLGAKDIYIVEALAFDLESLQKIREEKKIRFRILPDIAQSAVGSATAIPEITKFWVRPEDIELYEKYVDVFELVHIDERQSVTYEIYKQQQWLGDLSDLILDLNLEINNINLNPRFAFNRIGCRKKCMLEKCNLCQEIYNLSKKFEEAGISIIKEKKKSEIPQEEKEKLLQSLKAKNNL